MNRIRAILAAAAALVIGGSALTVALRDAGQSAGASCADWSRLVDEANAQPQTEWFVAVLDGFAPPAVVGDRVLGDCAAGACVAQPLGCSAPLSYTYQRSAAVASWRLYRVRGPAYFAVSWRALATAQPTNARFYRGWTEVAADCLANFTAANCRTLLGGAGVCWKRGAQFCRNGRLYGPGLGGVNADGSAATCTAQAGDVPYPCDSLGDAAWPDRATVEAFPSDGGLEP